MAPDKEELIIGLTGSFGSGCSQLADHLEQKGWRKYKLSNIIRKYIIESKNTEEIKNTVVNPEAPTREELQKIGNKLRQIHGCGYLADQIIDEIKKSNESKKPIVIDGIRNPYEIYSFNNNLNKFFTVAINASFLTRWDRLKDEYRNDINRFEKDDERDHSETMDFGQQVDKCVYFSDILINNEDTPNKYFDKVGEYIFLLEEKRKRLPILREQLMTHAYCGSLRSSCIKRRVGAVIATKEGDVISSAFNDVPKGEKLCVEEYGMCYRDKIKKDFLEKFKKCPECGTNISKKFQCPKCDNTITEFCYSCSDCGCKFETTLECSSCRIDIIKRFVPKELDKCRSLHAEEMAIVMLSKLGGGISLRDTILYTTTFPCLLCANKIVESGICEIIYTEPYPMKESQNLLEKIQKQGNIKLTRFEGIKGGGYFKIFDRIN